jgi:CPA1 family monovalent cation:H+ antiporter
LQQRGYFAFEPITDFYTLQQRLSDGWTVQTARLSKDFDLDRLKSRLGELGNDWLLLGSVSPQGELQIYSNEQPFKPAAGWTLLYFASEQETMAQAATVKQPTESHESPE